MNSPIVVVPIGRVQLQSVLEFYSIHAELRGKLSTDQGLQRMHILMTPPMQEGEGAASGAPVQAPTPKVGTPASPAPAYGTVPGSGSPYEDIQYSGPQGGQSPQGVESYGFAGA